MGNVPILKPDEVVAILTKLSFSEVRQRGSHKQFRNSAGRCTTVPFHQGRDISPVLIRQIAKDIVQSYRFSATCSDLPDRHNANVGRCALIIDTDESASAGQVRIPLRAVSAEGWVRPKGLPNGKIELQNRS